MSDGANGYVFARTEHGSELDRLRALERVSDPGSKAWLLRTGLGAGWRCLEVGAGAGSIARWMSETAGAGGHVTAVDVDARFLTDLAGDGLEVIQADIRAAPVAAASVDLVHARFMLIHLADWQAALEAMLRCVKPGGWLVLEEPDFSSARCFAAPPELRDAFDHVNRAIEAMFTSRRMDHAFGARLPALLEGFRIEGRLHEIAVENETPLARGGGPIAAMMALSTGQLRDKYVATGHASPEDIERYARFAADPTCWATYHGTLRAAGRAAAP